MIACSLKRVQNELKEMIKLKEDLGVSDETIKGYIDFLRWEFEGGLVITAEKYLELSSETERLSDEYLAEQMPSNK
jgi:MoaA/NifB/PqqE/SkfB family radical SAM enzyme